MQSTEDESQGVMLARNGQCQAEYSAAVNAVQVRVGQADLRLTPAEFLSLCATLLKAARTLGQQPYIPGLASPVAAPQLSGGYDSGRVSDRPNRTA